MSKSTYRNELLYKSTNWYNSCQNEQIVFERFIDYKKEKNKKFKIDDMDFNEDY